MSLLEAVIQGADKANTEDVANAQNQLLPKIIDFSERIMLFSWGLQNYYIDVYLTSNSSRSLEQMDYKKRKFRADQDLEELQEEIEAFNKEYDQKNEDINTACKKFEDAVKWFNDSCTLVDGTYIMKNAARDLKSLKYVDAIVQLKALHERLDKMDFPGNLGQALRSFRAISDTQLAVSQGQLSVEFSNLFRWNFTRGVHTLTYSMIVQQNDPILLERVLRALYIANQMIIDVQPYSHFFVMVLVPNIINHNCEIFTEDNVGALVFNIKVDLNDTERPSIPTIFNNLTAAFEFLETTMGTKLDADKSFFECFGDCNRDEFFNKIIHDCIKKNLPYCENSHQAYRDVVLDIESFNKFLVDLKYVEADKSPLKKYIENTDLLMYDTKYRRMLENIREMIKEFLCHSTVLVGTVPDAPNPSIVDVTNKKFKYNLERPLYFPKCIVSANVKNIVSIITTCLEESANMPFEYANQLIPYIKAIATMYQSMVTQKNAARLKTHALEIAIFFNNSQYLAHGLVGPPWKNILPKAIADQLNTVIMGNIYDLRLNGLEKMSMFLKRNRDLICTKIGGIFRRWSLEAFETFNRDVNSVLALLKELRDTWCGVLPGRMYRRAMSVLVEAMAEAMVKRSLRYVEDITEDVVCLIASRFQYTIDEIHDVFPAMFTLDPKTKYFDKFLFIPTLFTAQLMEIAKMWADNELDHMYSSDEVRLIIKMRFPSDEHRLKILRGIQ